MIFMLWRRPLMLWMCLLIHFAYPPISKLVVCLEEIHFCSRRPCCRNRSLIAEVCFFMGSRLLYSGTLTPLTPQRDRLHYVFFIEINHFAYPPIGYFHRSHKLYQPTHQVFFVELQGPGQWTNGIALNVMAVRAGCSYVCGDVESRST